MGALTYVVLKTVFSLMADWNVVSNPEFFMLCHTTSHILCAENTSECAIFCSLSTSGFKTDTSLMRIFLSWRLEKRRLFLSWRRPLSYRTQFLYDNGLRHERVKSLNTGSPTKTSLFFFGNNFYKNKETFKIFSPQILKVYRIIRWRLISRTEQSTWIPQA